MPTWAFTLATGEWVTTGWVGGIGTSGTTTSGIMICGGGAGSGASMTFTTGWGGGGGGRATCWTY